MAIQVRGGLPIAYDGIDKTVVGVLGTSLNELPYVAKGLFNTKSSSKKFERFADYTSFGDVAEKPEGGVYPMDTIRPGYTKDLTPVEFAKAYEITKTALEDDELDIVTRGAEMLAFSARYTQESYAARVFNNGFTTETSLDAVALFSASHTLAGGGTAANRPSTDADLSHTALQAAIIDQAKNLKLNSGQLVNPPDAWVLLVPPDLEFLAHQIINSTLKSDTADNATNALKRRRFEIQVWSHLSDTDAWFLVAANKRMHGLMTIPRIPIQPEPRTEDPYTRNRIYGIRFRQVWSNVGWRNLYGTTGA